MVRLEHLNLVIRDIPRALTFYQAAFPEWKIRDSGQSEWSGKPRNWAHFGCDDLYIAFADNGDQDGRDLAGHQVGLAHFAFETNDIKGVIARLTAAGFEIANPGVVHPYRQNVYFIDPDGHEVEFVQYFSDLVAQRNSTVE
ncbi:MULTISPECIES: VOC family protein [unclassified Motilimonas]|uniref:VOC family protein n=1 Tax=Motilimonas TaxID=1914248 RepID=UPI001E348E43|nr:MULTISPECIES: VOC family protein [unclassified Motilimonas]MCE0558372.1 VOC family protein [Motilimonas sp. E26]MDO6525276.1 VOC family protein [Motilimonas sp. 1_MG-2023]